MQYKIHSLYLLFAKSHWWPLRKFQYLPEMKRGDPSDTCTWLLLHSNQNSFISSLRPLRELLTWTETLRTSDTNICQRSVIFGVSTAVCWWLLPFYLSPVLLFLLGRKPSSCLTMATRCVTWGHCQSVREWNIQTSAPQVNRPAPYYIPHTPSKRSL